MQQALYNAWLKAQGLLSVKDLWCKAQGYTAEEKGKLSRASQLVEPPTADPHGGWCGGWRLKTPGYPIWRHVSNARKSLGCLTATFSSVRAAPVGSRRPCSQS